MWFSKLHGGVKAPKDSSSGSCVGSTEMSQAAFSSPRLKITQL